VADYTKELAFFRLIVFGKPSYLLGRVMSGTVDSRPLRLWTNTMSRAGGISDSYKNAAATMLLSLPSVQLTQRLVDYVSLAIVGTMRSLACHA
jgi:hypothetical protein